MSGRVGAGLLACLVGVCVSAGVAAPASAADPQCPQQKPGRPLGASAPAEPTIARLDLERAWKLSQGQGITVAVVDSGVDGSIPKLRPALVQGFTFQPANTAQGFSKAAGGNTGDCEAHGTPIASMIAARAWSAMTRNGASATAIPPMYFFPAISSIRAMIGRNRSVSKLLFTSWRMHAIRSSPAPVSTDGFGSGVIFPDASRSYCMKTRFQISIVSSPGPLTSSGVFREKSEPRK